MKRGILKILACIVFIVIVCICIITMAGYDKYKKAINEESLDKKISEIKEQSNYSKFDDVSEIYKNAVIAVEDHRFYKHCGIDVWAIMRAMARNIKYMQLLEGGSTITQQLAKNTYFSQNKDITRKVAEGFMAINYERHLSKNEILELYINTSYFGDGYYNVKEASLGYFDKLPNQLNDFEATMLAGVPNAPSVYATTVNFKLASERQVQVLDKMVKYKYITEEKRAEILKQTEYYREYFQKNKDRY